jgi:hypothetical protein
MHFNYHYSVFLSWMAISIWMAVSDGDLNLVMRDFVGH